MKDSSDYVKEDYILDRLDQPDGAQLIQVSINISLKPDSKLKVKDNDLIRPYHIQY